MTKTETTNEPKAKTGNWFYLCQGCHQPALIFRGKKLPRLILPIDQLDHDLLGTYRSRQQGIICCGFCRRAISLDLEGRVNQKHIIQVDSWCKAKGKKISKFGITGRPEQEKEGFFAIDEDGDVVPSKSESRWIITALAPDRPKVFATIEAP